MEVTILYIMSMTQNYVDFALNKIDPKHKVKYQGMEYRELIVDGKIAGGQKTQDYS
jgi:hypothetical protein